jgi:cyclopropane-fatty-acyl-phospholipid synthase
MTACMCVSKLCLSCSLPNCYAHAGSAAFRCFLADGLHLTPALHQPDQALLNDAHAAFDDALLAEAGIGNDSSVLEIGCGWGALAERGLQQHRCRCDKSSLAHQQLSLSACSG